MNDKLLGLCEQIIKMAVPTSMNTPLSIAAFPLSLAVLPGELVPLHLFENRYRQLLIDLEAGVNEFAIIYSAHGQMAEVATIVSIESVATRYENGTSDIIIKGERLVKVTDFYPKWKDKLYPGISFEKLPINDSIEEKTMHLFSEHQHKKEGNSVNPTTIYELALKLNLTQEQQLKLISADSSAIRNQIIRSALQFEDKIHHQIELLNGNYHLN